MPLRRAEELIGTLPGVVAARIVPSETGAVEEIHVLTTDQIAPKNTVRNIESALIAQLGLRVNHKKISVAMTSDAARPEDVTKGAAPVTPSAPPLTAVAGGAGGEAAEIGAVSVPESSAPLVSTVTPAASRRLLVFEDVEVRRSRQRGVLCRVTLMRGGVEFIGEAEGQESERSRIELASRAALQAIAVALKSTPGGERSIALEGAKLIDAFDREFVFVSLMARMGRDPVVLTGSCEVRESAETSAVLAVLDATNRWVHFDR